MNTRELIKKLNFDRFNVHTIGKQITEEIKQAEQLIAAPNSLSNEELKTLCKQVGLYYLFYVRDQALALHYVTKYQELIGPEDNEEAAHVLNLIGHAKTIDGGYKEVDIFNNALDIYAKLPKTREVQLEQAFAFRYISLILHRLKESEKAIENIKLAIEIQKGFQDSFPLVKIDLAESYHAWGVILARQEKLEEAEQKLLAAKALEDDFCAQTSADHFMKFTTMQSLGNVWMRQGKHQEAIKILTDAYNAQLKFFKTATQADIAKTLHFLGDAYMHTEQFDKALEMYEKSLAMKLELKLAKDMVDVTEDGVRNAKIALKNKDFNFDWNDYRTIKPNQNKIEELETFIEQMLPYKKNLSIQAKQMFADLCYKLGTFYNHIYIKREPSKAPDLALKHHMNASDLIPYEDQGWIYNHIAFSYQQKLAQAKKDDNKEEMKKNLAQAKDNFGYVISNYNVDPDADPKYHKIFAFAFCVRALVEYEIGELGDAIRSYAFAIKVYEDIGALDDQYARAKNRYAMIYADQKRYLAAQHNFEQLEAYWKKNQDPLNPYAARFYFTYGDFLTKKYPKDLTLALEKYQKAFEISAVSDGKDAEFTRFIKKKMEEVLAQKERLSQQESKEHSPTLFYASDSHQQSPKMPAVHVQEERREFTPNK